MRKIVVMAFMSLDGVVQAPGGPDEDKTSCFKFGGWVPPFFDPKIGSIVGESFEEDFSLLLGRKTYDIFANHWPKIEADPDNAPLGEEDIEISNSFNRVTKYVATHRPESLGWKNSEWLGRDTVAKLKELKKQKGPMLLTQGSADFIQTLFKNDLVDELRLLMFPIMLGKGKRLFGDENVPAAFKLVKSFVTEGGVVSLKYEKSGPVKTGDFTKPQT